MTIKESYFCPVLCDTLVLQSARLAEVVVMRKQRVSMETLVKILQHVNHQTNNMVKKKLVILLSNLRRLFRSNI